ncbi:hypothetical protein FBR01_01665 [Anaerolineae bacterium CFX8]|nr:hypothetical protein [Anaerolineae bacterium CFX8]
MRRVLIILIGLFLGACNLQRGAPTPLPTPDIPRVEFRFPVNGSTILEGAELTIELLAADAGDGVARVELLVDDVFHQEGKPEVSPSVPTFAVTMNWLAQGVGQHALTALAYRLDGVSSAPETIIIEVLPDGTS